MEVNTRKTDAVRALGAVAIQALLEKVNSLHEEDWLQYDAEKPNKYPSLKDTQHLVLKFSDKRGTQFRYYDTPHWEKWKALVSPVLDAAAAPYGYTRYFFPRVMLAKLPPGKKITPHTDGPQHESRPHKIHVPLVTNPNAKFLLPPHIYHFEKGMAYEVNNGRLHGVANNGSTDRIHLIFELLEGQP